MRFFLHFIFLYIVIRYLTIYVKAMIFFRRKQLHRYLASRNFHGFSQPTPNECPRALFPPHTKLLASACNLFHTPLSCCYLYCQTRESPETFTATLCTSKYTRVSFTGHISIGLVNISHD